MKKLVQILFILLFAGSLHIYGQGFEPPAEGKAVVYFVRTTGIIPILQVRYYDGDKLFHEFKKKNYIRYECDPGEHLFWAAVEKSTFNAGRYYLTADLEAGKSYIIKTEIVPAVGYAGISTVLPDDQGEVKKSVKLIKSKTPVEISKEKIAELNDKYKGQINQGVKAYEEKYSVSEEYVIPHMSSEMSISEEVFH